MENWPARVPGSRIVSSRGIPGTAGALARTRHDGRRVLLTTWHVLFGDDEEGGEVFVGEEAAGRALYGKLGLVQLDGDEVHVDCAVASYEGRCNDLPRGHASARAGQPVTKHGAATGITRGVIVSVDFANDVLVGGRTYRASRQILVRSSDGTPFSAEGDSGALLLDENERAVGLLWGANTSGEGVACPIAPVLYAMNITL